MGGHRVRKLDVLEKDFDKLASPVSALAIITTVDASGQVNAAAFATCVRNNHVPTCFEFTVDAFKDTAVNVLATNEFVINIPSFEDAMLERVRIVGLSFAPGVNELEKAKLTAIPSRLVKAPRVLECRAHFECKVEWTKTWLGSRLTVVGRVVAASVDPECVDADGYVRHEIMKPAQYCGQVYGGKFVAAYEVKDVPLTYEGADVLAPQDRELTTQRR
jgi:flavin reductase (DIM6/NTAB) family NADH-FMN oxidoreductase RutF